MEYFLNQKAGARLGESNWERRRKDKRKCPRPLDGDILKRAIFALYGAGYGNRTRLHGLGSRCTTDVLTLPVVEPLCCHNAVIINESFEKIKSFLP